MAAVTDSVHHEGLCILARELPVGNFSEILPRLQSNHDPECLLYLDGAEVDYVESLEGSGFKFSNPQVKSTCGCGSSFSV